jgi:glycosyltransferase involved in cell wall biosynthesis
MSKKKSKKKILAHSNHSRARTGFGKHMRHLLTYLYNTGKYDIVEFANGKQWNDPSLSKMPWKTIGSLPFEQHIIDECNRDQNKGRVASYGHAKIDDVIVQEKPDIYLGIEDIWGMEGFWKKPWWKKIHSIIWTPVDSLPLLDKHIDSVANTENYVVQASFAKTALEKNPHKDVHLFPVPIDPSNFSKMSDGKKQDLRLSKGINSDEFIIGFVFRNQLRKSVPNLLQGFKIFLKENPKTKAKLFLHTHWAEGWDIPKLLIENEIDPSLVLTTYFCDKCNQYEIKPFSRQNLDCPLCGAKGSQQTAQITRGVNEKQLNEIYNLMDVYCHAFTSGGQEIPIQEAKLTELITLVTSYACGEDYCTNESGGLPLNWSEYREPGTQFIKASTDPQSIAYQLKKVLNMKPEKKSKMGEKARDFAIDFCSIDNVCKKFEKVLSSLKDLEEYDFDISYVEKNPNYIPQSTQEDKAWIVDLYKNILKVDDVESSDELGLQHWLQRLNSDLNRDQVLDFFRKTAFEDNRKNKKVPFEDVLDKDDDGKRILFALPEDENDVFLSTSILKYIKDQYPDHNIYYATNPAFFNILNGNPHIHKAIVYDNIMENIPWSQGQGDHKGFFEFTILPHINTHKLQNFSHADKNPVPYSLSYA